MSKREQGKELKTPHHVPEKWSVSPYAWEPKVRKRMPNIPEKVLIRDVTLRSRCKIT
ncbi:MAG: hypothetical protein QME90_16885 [Thermodesulfobacteriota bacterium]|nr:hypothetical protein [Thermodesulfobacteriota bacterium]